MSDIAQTLYGAPTATPAPTPAPAITLTAADVLYSNPSPAPAPSSPPAPVPVPVTVAQPAPAPAAQPVQPVQSDAEKIDSATIEGVHTAETAVIEALGKLTPDDIRNAIPDAIVEARQADASRRLYADKERDALAESIPMDGMQGVPPETVAAIRTELANMVLDAGATHAEVNVFSRALADAKASPLTEETRIAARDQCIAAYNEAFGQEAYRTLTITRAWIQQDPRRHAIFAQVGDNPQIALLAARLALAAQRRR